MISHRDSASLKSKLFSDFNIENFPYEVQIEMAKIKMQITHSDWLNMSNQERGKLLAINIINNKVETLQRFYSELKSNSK